MVGGQLKINSVYSVGIFFLLIVLGYILIYANEGATSTGSLILRYTALPLSALWLGTVLAVHNDQKQWIDIKLKTYKARNFLISAFILYCFVLISLKTLKSVSLNYELFDTGLYINKLWRLAHAGSGDGWAIGLVEGHFQPIIFLYAFIYGLFDSPLLPFFLETITLASGVVPVYLLAKSKLNDNVSPLLIALAYLANPLLQFNDILGFHPDHIVLTSLLWAFCFAETRSYKATVVALIFVSLGSEPWIPIASAFGVYLWIGRGEKLLGVIVSMVFAMLFFCVLFWILPKFGSTNSAQLVFGSDTGYSPYSILTSGSIGEVFKLIIQPQKAFFVFFLLFPFLFLPLRSLSILIVAIPSIVKTLGSSELLHYSVEGHYTLALIAVMFVGYIQALAKLSYHRVFKNSSQVAIVTLTIMVTFSLVHGPLPVSFDFWSNWSAGSFNFRNYLETERTRSLQKAEKLIGLSVDEKVEISNGAFTPNLARRHYLSLFPSAQWKQSDYVLIDKAKYKGAGADGAQALYSSNFSVAVASLPDHFQLVVDDSNIQLWSKLPQPPGADFK
jgi:uncharacterized membrane protein